MLDLKPYGAFIEHTIRPLLEESEGLLRSLSILDLKKEDVEKALKKIAILHLITQLIETFKVITCTLIIGLVAWKISQ